MRRGLVKRIGRAMVLIHDRSQVGRVEKQTVDHIRTLAVLNVDRLFTRRSPRLDPEAAAKVVQSIR